MTGRLLVDGAASIDRLEYSSARDEPAWERFALRFDDGGDLRMRRSPAAGRRVARPRRVGAGARRARAHGGVAGRGARSQHAPRSRPGCWTRRRVAGIGNLLADEILWRAGLDPPAGPGSLSPRSSWRCWSSAIATTLAELADRGGSHTGDLRAGVLAGGHCPLDGTPLQRRTIGGRTTWSCPHHQV